MFICANLSAYYCYNCFSVVDIGWILIKQIMALVENNQLELLKRTLATSKSDAN